MAFIQNPLLRQRWNHISQTTETVTENAAAGIWTFQHRYITPCFSSAADTLDACTSLCIGDREERARRARERDRGARRSRAAPEYTFDFYDDWADDFPPQDDFDDDDGGVAGERRGILGRITGEDWDRLLAGTGGGGRRREEGEVLEQPRRKRGMSYGTRGGPGRRKVAAEDDPTVIPSTAPLGFLGRLPFRIGGTLRYKPSAANLKEHPGQHAAQEGFGQEREPLLGTSEEEEPFEDGGEYAAEDRQKRQRSNTAGSGATSDSYRSRNDLFPSDGEGDEDAVPLDDEFAVALDRVDDRGSNKTRSSKGKRVEGRRSNSGVSLGLARTVSRTTIGSTLSRDSKGRNSETSLRQVDGAAEVATPTMEDLLNEEEQARHEEEEEVERKRRRAARVALERGLGRDEFAAAARAVPEHKDDVVHTDALLDDPEDIEDTIPEEQGAKTTNGTKSDPGSHHAAVAESNPVAAEVKKPPAHFVPARLPHFQ